MKVQEFIKVMSEPKNKLLKAEQIQEVVKKNLEVKKYMGIKDKKELIDSIVNECILYEDGTFKFNDIDKYICFTMKMLEAYTNLELSSDFEDDYDLLCESELLEVVINTFKKEYDDVNILLQMKCDYMLGGNSIESQVGRFLDEVLDKVDVFTNHLTNKIDNFSLDNLPFNKEDLSKIIQLINIAK